MRHFFRCSLNDLIQSKEKKRFRNHKQFKMAIIKDVINFGQDLNAARRFKLKNKGKKLILISTK